MFLLDETKPEVILILLLNPVYTEQKSFPTLGEKKKKQADTNTFKGWPRRGMPVSEGAGCDRQLDAVCPVCLLHIVNY